MNCKICDGSTALLGQNRLMGKYDATYLRCNDCGFVFVVEPSWLDEAYSDAIADIDLGPVERMVQYSRRIKIVLHCFLDPAGTCLDYGGGYGILVRRMRDMGYDFRWYDKYCTNLFAKDFTGRLDSHYELLTAFEVLEHLTNPMTELEMLADVADNLLVSTLLIGRTPPPLDTWHYYATETGQHIGFFTSEAMQRVASRLSLHYASDGVELHLLSKKPIDARLFRIAMKHRVSRVLNSLVARPTLLHRDVASARKAAKAQLAEAATIEASTNDVTLR